MNTKNMKMIAIQDTIHLGGTSREIVEKFQQLVSVGIVDIENIRLITINYDTSSGEIEKAPVRIYFANGLALYLNLTAGYRGSGPSDLCKVLELCNIDFDRNDILSKQDVVDIKYTIGDINWQFCLFDNSYVYSF